MKTRLLISIIFLFLLTSNTFAEIPGKYEVIVPQVPPPMHSLDKVQMVEVFAFDCGHCYNFNRDMLPRLVKKFGKKLVFQAKPIGWRGHNPGRLLYIAEEKGKGHEVALTIFHLIFDGGLREQMFQMDKLQFVARKHNLLEEFKTLMESPRIIAKMNAGVQYAQSKNITSTPTLIIENSIMPVRQYDNLVLVINSLLKEPVN
jgi:protein dithiol oxidoreductase (disulfide-forming)